MKSKGILAMILSVMMPLSALYAPLAAAAHETNLSASMTSETTDAAETEIPDVSHYIEGYKTYSHNDETTAEIASGECGENAFYILYENGHLYVYGSGAMNDYNLQGDNRDYSPFYDLRNSVTEIIIEKGITRVGSYAFDYLARAKHIRLHEGLLEIGEAAFMSCNGVDRIYVPESVTKIEDSALGCKVDNGQYGSFVKSDTLIVSSQGSAAESYANDLQLSFAETYETEKCGDNAYWVLDNTSGVLTVFGSGDMYDREMYSESLVSYYNNCYNYNKITSLVFEDGITHVGAYIFHYNNVDAPGYNYGVSNITFADSVTSIGKGAFDCFTNITEVHLSNNLTTLDGNFRMLYNLKRITIPAKLNLIPKYESLEWINVSPENEELAAVNGVLYSKDLSSLLTIPAKYAAKNIELPENTTSISCSTTNNVLALTLPEGNSLSSDLSSGIVEMHDNASLCALVINGKKRGTDEFWNGLPDGITVFCDLSDDEWKTFSQSFAKEKNIKWADTSSRDSTLIVTAEKTTLNIGETTKLTAYDGSFHEVYCDWVTSDPDVALVNNGVITALNEGTAEMTASANGGELMGTIKIVVTADINEIRQYEIHDNELRELNEYYHYVNYVSNNGTERVLESTDFTLENDWGELPRDYLTIPCEKLGCVYLLFNGHLCFYSLNDSKMTEVEEFSDTWREQQLSLGKDSNCTYAEGDYLYVLSTKKCEIYDLVLQRVVRTISVPTGYSGAAVGADAKGKVYMSAVSDSNENDCRVFLFSETGELLDEIPYLVMIYRFGGFNEENGNFYMETYYDYFAWEFSHPGYALTMGNVTDDKLSFVETYWGFLDSFITRNLSCMIYLNQFGDGTHIGYTDMLAGRYAAVFSVYFSVLRIYDTSNDNELILSFTQESEDPTVGARAVYNEKNDSFVICTDECTLTEYDTKTLEIISVSTTTYPVLDLVNYGEDLIAIEKYDEKYFMELFPCDNRELTVKVFAEKETMQVGESQQMTAETVGDSQYRISGRWTSSDNSVISVSDDGRAAAWRPGKAELTFTSTDSKYKESCEVTVTERTAYDDVKKTVDDGGALVSSNVHDQNYSVWSSPMNSYLYENDKGGFTRVEFCDNSVYVENYTFDFSLIDSQKIEAELPLFGGFFSGKDHNYIVFGQSNEQESDDVEVMRVVKYTKDWQRVSSASVYGTNTYIPFKGGSLRMDEADVKLYIHTCHEMYSNGDDTHHQANMTFVLDEESMTFDDSYFEVSDFSAGYVSHSFNQFIKTDGQYVYRVDHGDGVPRAIGLSRINIGDNLYNVTAAKIYSIPGMLGYNETGVSLGGMELSTENVLTVIQSVDFTAEDFNFDGVRDIYLIVNDKAMTNRNIIRLTNYTESESCGTPQLVKIGEDQFLILWEEKSNGLEYVTAVSVDGSGNINARHILHNAQLSDCQPIFASDGMVKWYVTNGESIHFYSINPFFDDGVSNHLGDQIDTDNETDSDTDTSNEPMDIETLDLNGDGKVSLKDASLIQQYSVGLAELTSEQLEIADVNNDGYVDLKDAYLLQHLLIATTENLNIMVIE